MVSPLIPSNFMMDPYGLYNALSEESQNKIKEKPLIEEREGNFAVAQNMEAAWCSLARLIAGYAFLRFCSLIGCAYHLFGSVAHIAYGLIYTARGREDMAESFLTEGMEHLLKCLYGLSLWYFSFYASIAFAIAPSHILNFQEKLIGNEGENNSLAHKWGALLAQKLIGSFPPLDGEGVVSSTTTTSSTKRASDEDK